jgi:hypothetical protein
MKKRKFFINAQFKGGTTTVRIDNMPIAANMLPSSKSLGQWLKLQLISVKGGGKPEPFSIDVAPDLFDNLLKQLSRKIGRQSPNVGAKEKDLTEKLDVLLVPTGGIPIITFLRVKETENPTGEMKIPEGANLDDFKEKWRAAQIDGNPITMIEGQE